MQVSTSYSKQQTSGSTELRRAYRWIVLQPLQQQQHQPLSTEVARDQKSSTVAQRSRPQALADCEAVQPR